MFDMDSFILEASTLRNRQKADIENQRLKGEAQAKFISESLKGLEAEYAMLENNAFTRWVNEADAVDAAAIYAVQEAVYSVFHDSLLLDESTKDYYAHPLKAMFESAFTKVLSDNNIKTFKDFNKHIQESNVIVTSVAESAYRLAQHSGALYKHLLENDYSDSSTIKLVSSAYRAFTESDMAEVDQAGSVSNVAKAINAKLQDTESYAPITVGDSVANLITLGFKAFNIPGFSVSSVLFTVNLYLNAVTDAIKLPVQAQYASMYIAHIQDIQARLLVAANEANGDQNLFSRLESLIDRTGEVQNLITAAAVQAGIVQESTELNLETADDIIFAVENGGYVTEAGGKVEDKEEALITALTSDAERLKAGYSLPKGKLYMQKFIDALPSFVVYNTQTVGALAALVAVFGYAAVRALRSTKDSDRIAAIREVEKAIAILDKGIKKAKGDEKKIAKLTAAKKKLSGYLAAGKDGDGKKVFREDAHGTMEELVESALDGASYLTLFEATADEIGFIGAVVRDTTGDDSDKNVLQKTIQTNPCMKGNLECACLESALYDQTHGLTTSNIPHAIHVRLQEGQYPTELDFLDSDERELLETISKANGKDDATKIIKKRVVKVIENEEKRATKRDKENQEFLNKLTPSDLNKMKSSLEESAGKARIGNTGLNEPESLFEAMVVSRSRKYVQEAASSGHVDILENKKTILNEAIVLYTIHETFNTLNLEKYPKHKLDKMMNDYYYGTN